MYSSYTAGNVGLFFFLLSERSIGILNPRVLCVGGEVTAKAAHLTESERSSGVSVCGSYEDTHSLLLSDRLNNEAGTQ